MLTVAVINSGPYQISDTTADVDLGHQNKFILKTITSQQCIQ